MWCTLGVSFLLAGLIQATNHTGCPLPESQIPFPLPCIFTDRCDTDWDCEEDEACCKDYCGRSCKQSVYIKEGYCPPYRRFDPSDCASRVDECFSDDDCPMNDKCCYTICGNSCIEPYDTPTVHEGVCPYFNATGLECPPRDTELSCYGDFYCPMDEKCCPVECDNKCTKSLPRIVNPGTCPSVSTEIFCNEFFFDCVQDGDCPGEEKCCDNPCGRSCSLVKPKPGVCPVDFGGSCPLRDECRTDQECKGDEKCCRSDYDCGKVCVMPDPEYYDEYSDGYYNQNNDGYYNEYNDGYYNENNDGYYNEYYDEYYDYYDEYFDEYYDKY